MKLIFPGTRGEIDEKTDRHRRHTNLLVTYRRRRVLVDCGADWLGELGRLKPHAIVLTHAHPDHAFGLADGAPERCAVYATEATWNDIDHYPIEHRHTIKPNAPFGVEGIAFEAFTVEHSTNCPAVSYRIRGGRPTVLYCPDVVYIHERDRALDGAALYIGDGATLEQSMVRRRGDRLIGHTPVRTQLTWCAKAGVPEMIVTHCGSQIVAGDERRINATLREWAEERGVAVGIAHDGMARTLR